MSGLDKPLQLLGGAPLAAHVHRRLAPQVDRVVISANRHRAEYAVFTEAIIEDTAADCGPLGGINAVAQSTHAREASHLFVCPGDAPFLDTGLVARLSAALDWFDGEIAVPHDGLRMQHLFLFMRASASDSLAPYLASGRRSVHGWLAERQVIAVDATDIADSFLNINTMQDLVEASRNPAHAPPTHRAAPGIGRDHHHQDEEHS